MWQKRPYPCQHGLGTSMPSQSWALEVSGRSVSIGAVTRDNFATPRMQSPALQDISNRSVGGGEFLIAQEDEVQFLAACKSRRNLAARLANKLFTMEEKFGSNCRGACGKTALNYLKVQAIFATCSNIIHWIGWKRVPQQRGSCITQLMKCAGRPCKAPVNNENFCSTWLLRVPCWCCFFNNCCMCKCCMQSYVASCCANVQVDVSPFRSFDAAYEGNVLWVHTYLLGIVIFCTNLCGILDLA